MSFKSDMIELLILYAVIVVLSVLGIAWDIWSKLLVSGIDGIFLLLICLSMAGAFSLELLATAKTAGLIKPVKLFGQKAAESPSGPAPAAKPAATAAPAANPSPGSGVKAEGK
jgi:hypothetical protein